ncbi:DUF4265 domain-containing protein [Streptomyces sp. IB2014 016-6]|uniref:DUF4265 domain-containing protein n=1 Tax=Streptomyces sp. IB2014 016-6 TaxID=2517818 RepID=UPI00165050C0|nr:DUF4265 domain-containing protein [Streptomyces sp. IB2014 016-6]
MENQERSDRVRVVYKLQQEQGWPPVEEEGLWAVALSDDVVRIDNIPWFVRDLAVNDLVGVVKDRSGILRPTEKLSWAGICTIRIIPYSENSRFSNLQEVLDLFTPLGVTGEGLGQLGMVALAVPPDADVAAVKQLLCQGFEAEWWDYEEACVGGSW